MTVKDVIDRVSEWSRDIDIPEGQMIRLVNEVEKRLWDNIIKKHETKLEYTKHNDISGELMVTDEYGDIYVHYILATAYMRMYESERSAQHTALYNNLYASYGNYITREYMPKQNAKIKM